MLDNIETPPMGNLLCRHFCISDEKLGEEFCDFVKNSFSGYVGDYLIKLAEKGRNALANKDYNEALKCYEEAFYSMESIFGERHKSLLPVTKILLRIYIQIDDTTLEQWMRQYIDEIIYQ
jgi:hypothetical protein